MDKYEHRRLRLLEARDKFLDGSTSALADKIGRSASYVSRMLYPQGKDGKKRIAEDMVDIIEEAFAWGKGWMDADTPLPDYLPSGKSGASLPDVTRGDALVLSALSSDARDLVIAIAQADERGLTPNAFSVLKQTLALFEQSNPLPDGTLGVEDPTR